MPKALVHEGQSGNLGSTKLKKTERVRPGAGPHPGSGESLDKPSSRRACKRPQGQEVSMPVARDNQFAELGDLARPRPAVGACQTAADVGHG